MPWFRKHHTCPCGTDWWDEWESCALTGVPSATPRSNPTSIGDRRRHESAKIRALNDRFRKSLIGGRVMMTKSR